MAHHLFTSINGVKEALEDLGIIKHVLLGRIGVDPSHHVDDIIIFEESVEGLGLQEALSVGKGDVLGKLIKVQSCIRGVSE